MGPHVCRCQWVCVKEVSVDIVFEGALFAKSGSLFDLAPTGWVSLLSQLDSGSLSPPPKHWDYRLTPAFKTLL